MTGKIASRNYSPGDLIYSEEAFAFVVPRKLKNILCESCGEKSPNLKMCMQCKAVKYCGRKCQKMHWRVHRLECTKLANLPEVMHTETVWLLGKLILKIKGKDWKVFKKCVLGTDYSFDDVDPHCNEMTGNTRHDLLCKELKQLTASFIGEQNMPGDDEFTKIFGKNTFYTHIKTVHGFFIGLSLFDLECIPNANVDVCGNIMKIWAIKSIRKGVDKITVASRPILMPDNYSPEESPCKCTDCSLPYGESVLTRIVDENRAYSMIRGTETILHMGFILSKLDMEEMLILTIDDFLERQTGVLGDTHRLRLRLMAYRCLNTSDRPQLMRKRLLELEEHMSSVFGERYSEMETIYEALSEVHLSLFRPFEALHYRVKAKQTRMQ